MYAVLETNGNFSGVVYEEMDDNIKTHHTQYGQSFIVVNKAPEDIAPVVENTGPRSVVHIPVYGSPTAEQIEANRIRISNEEHQAYLDSTNHLVLLKVETGEDIPPDVLTRRAEARAALT